MGKEEEIKVSTRGVVIVRKKKEKPEYFYVRSDADMYPEFQRRISGKNAKEYTEKINKHVSTHVEGYDDEKYREMERNRGINPDLLRQMNEIEAKNYISSLSATPDHVYVVDLDGKKRMKHYEPNPYCRSDEVYIPAYVKDDGTYVKGYCRKVKR